MATEAERTPETRFSEAYEAYADAIFRFAWFRLFDRSQARDVTQESFLRYWNYLRKGEEVTNDRALLYKITANLVIDTNQKRVPSSLDDLLEQGFEPRDESQGRMVEFLDGVRAMKATDQLDPKTRQMVMLRFADGLSSREVGEITGDSEGAVNVRVHRGLKKLRQILEGDPAHAGAHGRETATAAASPIPNAAASTASD